MSFFADNCCFLTPDATAVHGRGGIRTGLAQLATGRVRLRVASQDVQIARDLALCSERWVFTYKCSGSGPFTRTSDSTVVLRRFDRTWRLTVVAPWRHVSPDRFLSAPPP
jgi:ketosteroid isomerase-like protein